MSLTLPSAIFMEADETLDFLYIALEDIHRRYSANDAMDQVISIYQRADDVTRYKIVTDLTEIEYVGVVPFLIDVLENDKIPLIRHEAAYGIGAIGNLKHAKKIARALLEDESPMVRHEVAVALAEIGGIEEIPALEIAANDDDQAVALSAKYAIQSILVYAYQGLRAVNG